MIADERTGELLPGLPSLTTVNLYFDESAPVAHVDFLSQLPLLISLTLHCYNDRGWSIHADAVLASLVLCTHITELYLTCGLNSAQLSALFANLKLKKLEIRRGEAEALRCFASGPITQSLEDLSLEHIVLSPSDLSHLYALRRLRSLRLHACLPSRLDEGMHLRLCPPTALLPALTRWYHSWKIAGVELVQDRQGPSFEWMQTRRTQ